MKQFIAADDSAHVTPQSNQLDIFAFQHQNPQLLSWMQELDINPYTLDPFSTQSLTTDIKVLYPNFFKNLYQTPASSASASKS